MKGSIRLNRKPFDRELYDRYDGMARDYAKHELEAAGYSIEDNERKMGVDLIVRKDGDILFYVECEIKTALDKPFHYKTLQLPERKLKFCGLSHPTLFTLFNTKGDKYFAVWDKFVRASPLKEVYNKYVSNREFFFQIPVVDCNKDIAGAMRRKWRRTSQ